DDVSHRGLVIIPDRDPDLTADDFLLTGPDRFHREAQLQADGESGNCEHEPATPHGADPYTEVPGAGSPGTPRLNPPARHSGRRRISFQNRPTLKKTLLPERTGLFFHPGIFCLNARAALRIMP